MDDAKFFKVDTFKNTEVTMDIQTFEASLNSLIQSGCTEISACFLGDDKRVVIHEGCEISGSAKDYLKILGCSTTGFVVADYRDLSSISFRVSDNPQEFDFRVRQITQDGKTAVINVG